MKKGHTLARYWNMTNFFDTYKSFQFLDFLICYFHWICQQFKLLLEKNKAIGSCEVWTDFRYNWVCLNFLGPLLTWKTASSFFFDQNHMFFFFLIWYLLYQFNYNSIIWYILGKSIIFLNHSWFRACLNRPWGNFK